MKDEEKTKKQLIQELDQMRQRVAQLEALEIEYKQTEEALRESEESLRALLNAIRESAFLMDTEGIVLQANEAVASRLGISVEQFVGSCAYDSVSPEVCKRRKERATEVIRTGRIVRFEDMRHDRYINNTIYPIFDRAGKVIKMAILGIDITERKQAEEALRESEERFRSIVENSEVGYFYIDREGRFQEVNDAWLRMHKYTSRDEVIGQHFAVTQVDRDLERAQKIVDQLLHGAPIPKDEFTRRCKDGSIGYHMFSVIPVKKGGNIIGLEGFLMDATERKRAEEALRESEEKYRTLTEDVLDNTTVGIFILDSAFLVVWVNQALEDYFGLRKEQVIGQDKRQLIHERIQYIFDDPEHFANTVLATYDNNTYIEEFESHIVRGDNRQDRWLEHRSQPILSGLYTGGRVELYYDITKRKQAEKQLQQYAVEVKEANEELSQYAYVVSHDLKAPLRAIRNYADFLREDLEATLDEEQRAYLEGLNRAVQEANALIEDLLELSRIGQREIEVETLEVGSFLHALFPSLDLPADVEIIMGGDWPTLTTEPVLLRQIFQNLINNAVKFNESAKKRVELGWQQVGEEHYEFFVRDNGIGFDLGHQEKIFRVFERLHTKEEFDGTGVGLAIVKKAVGKLGGSIRVESQPGEGSTFFVMLPKTTTDSTTNWE